MAVLLPAIAHLLVGIGVIAHKSWARWAGMTIGVLGVFVGVLLLFAQIDASGWARINVFVACAVLAYGFTAAALAFRAEHFYPR